MIRKILRNMYRKAIPHRQRRKTFRSSDGRIIPGTYRQWLNANGPAKYLAAIAAKNAKAQKTTTAPKGADQK